MKKSLGLLTTGLLTFVLGGCGQSAQDAYTNALAEQANFEKYNGADFSFSFDELDIASEGISTDAMSNMIATQLKDMKLSGSYLLDSETEAVDYNMKVDVLGQEITADFLMSDNAIYYSGDSYADIIDVATAFAGDTGVDYSGLNDELAGNYVKLDQSDLDDTISTDSLSPFDFSNFGSGEQSKVFAEFSKTLDKDSFEKDGDVISHTYDKKELADMIEFIKENGTDNMKETLQDADVDIAFENLDKFDITVSVDTKTNKVDYKIVLADDDDSMDITLNMSLTPKKEDTTITIPSDDKVITMEEFEEMMQNSVQYTLTDEDFDELYSVLEDVKDVYTKEELQDMLEDYSFTDEQQTEIDALYE